MANRTDTYYAATGAIHGYGAQLMVGDGASPETFEAIAGVVSITPGRMCSPLQSITSAAEAWPSEPISAMRPLVRPISRTPSPS